MARITLLTGPAASGKNTIAHVYATEFSAQCAVIDTDLLRWMLRNPHLAPWPTDPPDSPAQQQHRLGIKHACLLARSFVENGYEVVICDAVGDGLARLYQALLAGHDFRIVLLLPTWEEALRRLKSRPPTITEAEARLVYDQQNQLSVYTLKIDNSDLTPQAVATRLVTGSESHQTGEGR